MKAVFPTFVMLGRALIAAVLLAWFLIYVLPREARADQLKAAD